MAIISRFCAVANIGRVRLAGITGWLLWLAVHLLKLVGFKNRVTAVLHWFVSFVSRGRLDRTVTDLPFALHHGGAAMRRGAFVVRDVHEAGTDHARRRVRGARGLRRSGGQAEDRRGTLATDEALASIKVRPATQLIGGPREKRRRPVNGGRPRSRRTVGLAARSRSRARGGERRRVSPACRPGSPNWWSFMPVGGMTGSSGAGTDTSSS
jgi:hypothetical protein